MGILGFCGLNIRLDLIFGVYVSFQILVGSPSFSHIPTILLLQRSTEPALDLSAFSSMSATEQCPHCPTVQHQLSLAFSQLPDEHALNRCATEMRS